MQFHFSDHVLDVDLRELTRGGENIAVEPQVFDLLTYLVENRDRVVTKDDLIETIWNGRIVSESTLTSRINAARTAVGDSGKDQAVIRTIARKGFRFVSDVATAPARASVAKRAGGTLAPQGASRPALSQVAAERDATHARSIVPPSPYCPSSTSPANPSRNISPKASARTSSPRCRSCAGSMSSPATPPSSTRASRCT